MNLRETYRYAIACPTSMGLRITPENRMAVQNSNLFYLQATSAESNVLNIASSLGHECLVLTKFVKGSPVADFIKRQLRARNIRFEGLDVEQGGPWGYRHQFNIADSGFGLRAPRVWNDRAGEVGRTLSIEDFDVDRIFGQEGVAILHLSGLIAAMSHETTECCLALAKAAKQYGTLVSLRPQLPRHVLEGPRGGTRPRRSMKSRRWPTCSSATRRTSSSALASKAPKQAAKTSSSKIESFKAMISQVKQKYPNAQMFATTLRQVISANEHLWGAIVLADGRVVRGRAARNSGHGPHRRRRRLLGRSALRRAERLGSRNSVCNSAGPAAFWQHRASTTMPSLRTRSRSGISTRATPEFSGKEEHTG